MLRIIGQTYDVPVDLLKKVASAAFSFLEDKEIEIELKFVSQKEIIRLNTVYRGKNVPTDVLSFVIDKNPLLGQIFICYTFTKKQAAVLNKTLADEVALLLVHGILHIVGYDHCSKQEDEKMQQLEKTILAMEGIKR